MSGGGLRIGTDLLEDSLAHGHRPKIVFDGYDSKGFDVMGLGLVMGGEEFVYMKGSCVAFPHACYMWTPSSPREVTTESLAVVEIHDPKIDILLIGSDKHLPPRLLNRIRNEFLEKGIVVEQMDVMHACATFNVLNGEDRNVAVALIRENEGDTEE
mmetsp:Transcript_32213/g.47396  ORF Transcript_32213/g.47396 Transcript_32213/m.47396 type:complete len:156 (-) Transcript_32213:67-534(-)